MLPNLLSRRSFAAFAATLAAMLLVATGLFADDWKLTGSGTRVKTVAFIDVNVYDISHYMKELPPQKSKQAVIEMETGKKFVWTMRRDVDKEKIHDAIKGAFQMNGYGNQEKINKYLGAFSGELKEKSHVYIEYSPEKKSVTVKVDGGGSATIEGADFMKAVWVIWFGKIDQPKLGDALISKI
jgi:hypothetical protein